ncbi:MAG: hypothetical protein ACOY0T_23655 [Myxococcota bacterium]
MTFGRALCAGLLSVTFGRALCVGLVSASSLLGCASARSAGTHEFEVHQYVFGAFGGRALDLRDICENGARTSFVIRRSAGDYLVSVLSVGLYVPHRVHVRCEADGQ